jgi:hypothetical protein
MSLVRFCQVYLSLLLHYQIAIVGFVMRLGYVASVAREICTEKKEAEPEISEPPEPQQSTSATVPDEPSQIKHVSSLLSTVKNLIAKTMAPIPTEDAMREDKDDNLKTGESIIYLQFAMQPTCRNECLLRNFRPNNQNKQDGYPIKARPI